jgi:NADP-dependent 3-hydroxy acid dehydrogenase YdfG
MEFRNKVVLVVGASSGMGRSVALRLAREGAIIVATARRAERLDDLAAEIGAFGGECMVRAADAEDEAAAAAVVADTVARYKRIDAVLLNAGGAPAIDMRKLTASDVKSYMRSNYDVVVNYLVPVLSQMRQQGHGLVAHTNSLAGFAGIPLQGPYCAAKAAARLLLDTCRIEFAAFNIRFVTVYPGFVATEGTADDGMPAPMEIPEARATDHIMKALHREKWDYLFPLSTASLVRLLRVLPKSMSALALKGEYERAAGVVATH